MERINEYVGYQALIEMLQLRVIPHYRQSFIAWKGRGYVRMDLEKETHVYPKEYALKDPKSIFSQLEFALKYDGINLEILKAVFEKINQEELEGEIKQHPNSKYFRIMWFLYEFLTNQKLKISEMKRLKYVDVLDPEQYFTSGGIRSQRHRVNNNLLGTKEFCPIIRKTDNLIKHIDAQYGQRVELIAKKYNPHLLARASHYLYTKETLSSYEIEREKPSLDRMNRFIELLKQAPKIEKLTKEYLIMLQNSIVDPRFKQDDYRVLQNYVGENINQYIQKIHYIAPKPDNVPIFMQGLLDTLEKTKDDRIHPVLIATMISFGFVFIHPFEDGNGRIHRFLIHYILSKENFTPHEMIFPISAVMLQNILEYDRVLEYFSKPLMEKIKNYTLSFDGILTVNQSTEQYYRYIDYTRMAEYLFECINKTIHGHFEKEIQFLINYDKTKIEIQNNIDMPDRYINLFIKFVMQNHGKLSQQKKLKYFQKLNDDEINELESIVKKYMLNNDSHSQYL